MIAPPSCNLFKLKFIIIEKYHIDNLTLLVDDDTFFKIKDNHGGETETCINKTCCYKKTEAVRGCAGGVLSAVRCGGPLRGSRL